jgi:ribosomal protein S27AE
VKTCNKCGAEKELAEFYLDAKAPDGRRPDCRDCNKARARARYYAKHDEIMAAEARRRQRPEHREKNRLYRQQSDKRYPEKCRARVKLHRAVDAGLIAKLPCHKCGHPVAQAHHEDYSRPLDVEWICVKCHAKEHRTSPEGLAARAVGR